MSSKPQYYVNLDTAGAKEELKGVVTTTGIADAGRLIATNAVGQIDTSLIPGTEAKQIEAFEALAAGDIIYLLDDGGTTKMAKADASDPAKSGVGYILSAVSLAAIGTAYGEGYNTSVSGLTVGQPVFLDNATPGGVASTDVSAGNAGHIHQVLGTSYSATSFKFEISDPIKRAA